jgi:leader peptidase (prepilin peptidase)/N-methyltransferase
VLVKQDNKYQLLFPLLIATHPITLIDLNHHKIPNNLNFFLALSQTLILAIGFSFNFKINFIEGVIAGFLMTSLFLIMNALSGGQLGMGDVKLAYVLGLVTGIISYDVTVLALLIMFLFSGLYSLLLILFGKVRRDSYIAFGPFMLFGTWMAHLLAPLFI